MNTKTQTLINALKDCGLYLQHWDDVLGNTQIDIDATENSHVSWCVGDSLGVAIIVDSEGKIKDITE